MIYNNINIKSDKIFTYMFGYDDLNTSASEVQSNMFKFQPDMNRSVIYLMSGDGKYFKNEGFWCEWNNQGDELDYIKTYKPARIRVFFPDFSLDVYKKHIYYGIEVYTYLNDIKIVLDSRVISRIDTLAVDKVINKYGYTYYEYYDINIVNPFLLMFSEEWSELRGDAEGYMETPITVAITPLQKTASGLFIGADGTTGGQNSVKIASRLNPLTFSLSTNYKDSDKKCIRVTGCFSYNIYNTILEYISKSYNIPDADSINIHIEFIVSDGIDVYKRITFDTKSDEFDIPLDELLFDNWIGYREGMIMTASASIDFGEESILYILSNKIPLTQELFAYLVKGEHNYINLDEIDMKVYNINAINKNIIKTVNLNSPENSKSNIIQPVFFRSRELSNIMIHPEITENICINLDQYKSKVKGFALLIEGISFPEIGRTISGVIFKVTGNKLPKQSETGNFYITNESGEVITNGKYKYDV